MTSYKHEISMTTAEMLDIQEMLKACRELCIEKFFKDENDLYSFYIKSIDTLLHKIFINNGDIIQSEVNRNKK